jgi:uncharacterized protein (TIGR01777 family)
VRVLVSGSHGLIGSALVESLERDGHQVTRLIRGRIPQATGEAAWDPKEGTVDEPALEGHDAAVHLAGAGLGDHRWTSEYKKEILESRVRGTLILTHALAKLDRKPSVLVSGSAVGYYGDRGDDEMTEDSGPGAGFLAEVVRQWEAAALPAKEADIRTVSLRSGIVQSAKGGGLKKLLLPFKLGLGGRFGSGRQWLSWVHVDDEVAAIRYALEHDSIEGPMNATSPNPATIGQYAEALGRAVHRPTKIPTPTFALKAILGGEMTDEMLLGGQRVLPAKLQAAGFEFRHPDLDEALADVLGDP